MPNLKLLKIKTEMLLRKAGNKFGVDVKITDEEILLKQLRHNKIDVIFDIGANTGQFAELLLRLGYEGRIVSFEPLKDAHARLSALCGKYKNWETAERCAIGDSDGEIEIHVSENSISSSALEILDEHVTAAPGSRYVGIEKAKVYRLDTVGDKYAGVAENIFLKIDTQGFEEKILNGAEYFLKRTRGLLVETSLVKLYDSQALFREIYDRITAAGFEMHGIQPAFVNKETGRVLQVDAVFFRS